MSERRSYTTLDGGTSWFDLDEATRWQGIDQDKCHRNRRGFDLFRTRDGIWIKCRWNEYGPWAPHPNRLPFWQVGLNEAASWFHENYQVEPPELFDDLDRERRGKLPWEQPAAAHNSASGTPAPARAAREPRSLHPKVVSDPAAAPRRREDRRLRESTRGDSQSRSE
jgi:hypothetical protein